MTPTRIASFITLLTCFLTVLATAQSSPQASPPELDHVTRYVRDLQKSADFYDKIMQLSRIPDPFKDGQHIWYRIGAHEQMHLVAGATDVPPQANEIHVAFRYFQDPDGYWIEVNNDKF